MKNAALRSKKARQELAWTVQVLNACYVENGQAYLRAEVVWGRSFTRGALETSRGFKEISEESYIALYGREDLRGELIKLQLPSASSGIHAWKVPQIELNGCGKTFYYDEKQLDLREESTRRLKYLLQQGELASRKRAELSRLRNENKKLRDLVNTLVGELHVKRREAVQAVEHAEQLARRIESMRSEKEKKGKMHRGIVKGPWSGS